MILIPDKSVIVDGLVSRNISKLKPTEIVLHESLLVFFEKEARDNKVSGHLALSEIKALKPKFQGNINDNPLSAPRELALSLGGTLYTADSIQAGIAESKGIKYILEKSTKKDLVLDGFFDHSTMSVHIRQSEKPYAKKGKPGSWTFEPLSKKIEQDEIEKLAREIMEEARLHPRGFIEIERPGSTIIQLDKYRIVITRPPFSDGWEITAVRPVRQLSISDYSLSEKLMERISGKAEGVLIAGSPGMGKSTFAAALAEFYADDKIVKTVEAPRDLVLRNSITQYAISHSDPAEIRDILLLSRPDYTFFDEMRNTNDFKLFADLRLAGIGFIGVVHATLPVDAIQRFVGRIELGVIPQVIDTVVFIKDGDVAKVLSLSIQVKVPSGMTEADLARPVVVVKDFETGKPFYELYTYGEQTVVMPVRSEKKPAHALAARQLEAELSNYSEEIEVEMTSDTSCDVFLPEKEIPKLIGKQGSNISELEKKFGISISAKELELDTSLEFDSSILSKSIIFNLKARHADKEVNLLVAGDYLLTARVSKKGVIKVKKGNRIGKLIEDGLNAGTVKLVEQ